MWSRVIGSVTKGTDTNFLHSGRAAWGYWRPENDRPAPTETPLWTSTQVYWIQLHPLFGSHNVVLWFLFKWHRRKEACTHTLHTRELPETIALHFWPLSRTYVEVNASHNDTQQGGKKTIFSLVLKFSKVPCTYKMTFLLAEQWWYCHI